MRTTVHEKRQEGGAGPRGGASRLRAAFERFAGVRRRPVMVTLAASIAQVLFAVLLARASHPDILGVAGAEAVLVGLVAAVLGGPWSGVVTTGVGAAAFWYFISDHGETAPTEATLFGILLWMAAVLVAGFITDALRAQVEARRRADQESAALHERLESALLPTIPASWPGCRTTTLYRPGEERLGLGGDFYDLQVLDGGAVALLIGDVTGHGPDSAALGASLRAAWRGLVRAGVEPPGVLSALADVQQGEAAHEDLYVTVWLGWLTPSGDRLTMCSLGHPAPLLLAHAARYLECRPVPPLGVVPDPAWEPAHVELPAAWTIVLYTDGLIEGRAAPDVDERFGDRRLLQWFVDRGAHEADGDTLAALVAALEEANGGRLPDDLAVLALTRTGSS